MMNLRSLLLLLWLCISVSLSSSSKAVDCSTDTVGLCTPTIEEIIDETVTETIQYGADGYTVTTETITDENCERIKLSRSLYSMGMKVAAVSTLCADYRIFDSMWMAGTYCPYMGAIGAEAKEGWEQNPDLVPAGSRVFGKIELTQEDVKEINNDEFAKFVIAAMALYIGFPILF